VSVNTSAADAREAVDGVPVWYHTLEVAPGVVTPGYFDLRPIADLLPWPDVEGKRCLDIASFDGFYSFQLEQRGAAEVVAVDVPGPEDFDWPPRLRAWGVAEQKKMLPEHAAGFDVAKRLLGSSVERVRMGIYDLTPERVGEFDVVTCGSLLLHLRDPLRGLEAVRGVCRGRFMSIEQVDLRLTAMHPRQPVSRIDGESRLMQWSVPNAAGHRQMLRAAGFDIERVSRPLGIGYGPSHPFGGGEPRSPGLAFKQLLGVGSGEPHQAVVCRPWTS
jgi:tRNA (mo5U34)-methyltransferase